VNAPQHGPQIRPLEPAEKALREKWTQRVAQKEQAARRAQEELAGARETINDLALALNHGEPCVMTAEGLYEVLPNG
jgi:hypothetical protein